MSVLPQSQRNILMRRGKQAPLEVFAQIGGHGSYICNNGFHLISYIPFNARFPPRRSWSRDSPAGIPQPFPYIIHFFIAVFLKKPFTFSNWRKKRSRTTRICISLLLLASRRPFSVFWLEDFNCYLSETPTQPFPFDGAEFRMTPLGVVRLRFLH